MRSSRHWLATAPLPFHFLVMSVSFAVGTWALGRFFEDDTRGSWWGHAIGGVLYGALMTAYLARRRRQDGGAEQQWAVATAIRRGRLPQGADAEQWRPVLERKARELQPARTLTAVVFGLFSLLGIALALGSGPRWWVVVAFFTAFAVFGVVVCGRAVTRIHRMQQLLGPPQGTAV